MGAIILALFPPIFCLLFTHNVRLTRAQNAIENTDLAGRATGEIADPAERGSMRLHGASPAKRLVLGMNAGDDGWNSLDLGGGGGQGGTARKDRRPSGWRTRGLEEDEEGEDDGLLGVRGL
jgi:hypothetical protein